MINAHVYGLCGMGLADLGDTVDLCYLLDEVETLLEDGEEEVARELIETEIDTDWIGDNVFG